MVHICLNPSEIFHTESSHVDTILLVGTKKGYAQHFDWAFSEVLSPALLQHQTTDTEQPKAKRAKTTSSDDTGAGSNHHHQQQEKTLLQSILSGLQPSLDNGTSSECYLIRSNDNHNSTNNTAETDTAAEALKPLKVVLGVLPANVARHNSPGQPHAIVSILKKTYRPKDRTIVVPLCESPDYVCSVACALARVGGSMMYSRKTSSTASSSTSNGNNHEASTSTSATITTTTTTSSSYSSAFKTVDWKEQQTNGGTPPLMRVVFPYPIDETMRDQYAQLSLGIQLTRRLVDLPCNELNTLTFTEQATRIIQGMDNVTSRIIKGEDLLEQGFGGLYNVGKAAAAPPILLVLSYEPPSSKGRKSTVLVGKGVVFDTGGTQIKTKTGMPGMKRDMGGAAAILSAFVAVAKSDASTQPLHAVLCLAENSVASHAMRPDDVITMHSGRTVEVNNTDAEGRLVLSDGISFAIDSLNPHTIIDMATLTGAQGVATGKYFGAIYTNDETLEQSAIQAGKHTGDLCHPVPYAPEFFRPEFTSAVADMKNSVADRANAQVSCAGQFIANHMGNYLEDGGRWMHIDMAYCVYDKKDERATGYGVALLYRIVHDLEGGFTLQN